MSKSLRFPKDNECRRYRGLNNNILLVIVTFNNLRGGLSALPSPGLLCGEPVLSGVPGIRLAHSSSRLAHSLLPALCRQDTSWTWRLRLRSCAAGHRGQCAKTIIGGLAFILNAVGIASVHFLVVIRHAGEKKSDMRFHGACCPQRCPCNICPKA